MQVFFSVPLSFAFSLYCYGQFVFFFSTVTCSVVLQFRKRMMYTSSGACFRCRRADGAMSVWSGPCPQVYQDCYSKLHISLCCKLWNSSPWFPASLIPHEVDEGMLRPEIIFLSEPKMWAGVLCGSSWNPWGCLNQLFWLSTTWMSLFEAHSVHCHLSKKQGRAMDSSWRSSAGLSVVWILYSLLAASRALQLAGACIRKIIILSRYLSQLYF